MKVCITAQEATEEAGVDPRFGRCAHFCFYDTEEGTYTFENNSFTHETGGVGVQASQHLVTKGVSALLTGEVGPNAFKVLEAAEIPVYTGITGTVAEAVAQYRSGNLEAAARPTNRGHIA
ncbi:MAG: NifB/NifX family molybdenum-iron cluster-binding protein [Spirochaetota bacterium]